MDALCSKWKQQEKKETYSSSKIKSLAAQF
jgi:hypothetical protein